jgi:hypothetical protein
VFVGRGNRSKGGTGKVFTHKGKKGPSVRAAPRNLPKAVANQMIVMRLSGKTQAECDAWLERVIQEIERAEGEHNG